MLVHYLILEYKLLQSFRISGETAYFKLLNTKSHKFGCSWCYVISHSYSVILLSGLYINEAYHTRTTTRSVIYCNLYSLSPSISHITPPPPPPPPLRVDTTFWLLVEIACITFMYFTNTDVPDPPVITSLSLEGNSLRSSWDYVRILTVDVTLYWSLSFFRPSQLSNMTTTLLNTNTYLTRSEVM